MGKTAWLVTVMLTLAGVLGLWLLMPAREEPAPTAEELDFSSVLSGTNAEGFARALDIREFRFPEDHGPHPDFRSEWWYFTGNLTSANGRRFGYELALFRFALTPEAPERSSDWATNQVYMGHLAITDPEAGEFRFHERLDRGAAGLAGAQANPFRVWLGNWSVAARPGDPGTWLLEAAENGVRLTLELTAAKPIVLQGDRGLSQKSAEPGNASYYYSIPRLNSAGELYIGDQRFAVNGQSWMDREWSTSALSPDQAGWDWFALQLSNGWDLMYYQLRNKDGTIDPHSAGTLIAPDGQTRRLTHDDVELQVLEQWNSPRGGVYPARWRMTIKPIDVSLEIHPILADQELAVSVRYWEGAVDARGAWQGQAIEGRGYVELTGYGRRSR